MKLNLNYASKIEHDIRVEDNQIIYTVFQARKPRRQCKFSAAILWYQEIEIERQAYLGAGLSRVFNFNASGCGYRIYASVGNFSLSASARAGWSMAQASIIILITNDCPQSWHACLVPNVGMAILSGNSYTINLDRSHINTYITIIVNECYALEVS